MSDRRPRDVGDLDPAAERDDSARSWTMASSGTARLQRWRVVTIVGQFVVAAGYGLSALRAPMLGLMMIPSLAIIAWSVFALRRVQLDQADSDGLVAAFGVVRGLGLGTLCWVVLSLVAAALVAWTGVVAWGLLGVLGALGFVWIGSAHRNALAALQSPSRK